MFVGAATVTTSSHRLAEMSCWLNSERQLVHTSDGATAFESQFQDPLSLLPKLQSYIDYATEFVTLFPIIGLWQGTITCHANQ